jgi:hypothetical protein
LLAIVEATRGGGRRTIEVVYRRAPTPGPPALVWLSDPSDVGWVSGTMGVDGRVAGRPGWASLAAPGEPTILDAWLGGQGGAVTASADTGLPIWAPPPDLAGVVAAAIAAGPLAPGTGLLGSPPAPAAVTFAPGNLSVTMPRWAAGALVVDGRLDALVRNPADVIISLADNYYSGSPGFAKFVDIASTHGGLNRSNSTTFIMSTIGPMPPYIESHDIPRNLSKLTGTPFPMKKK